MKKTAAFLLSLIAFLSCSRHGGPGADNHCIASYFPSTGSLVSAGALDTIDGFFSKNNLSTSGIQFLYLDSFNTVDPTSYSGPAYQVVGTQIFNGLPGPNASLSFTFDSTGTLLDSIGGYSAQFVDKDTSGHQSLATLRQLFLNNYKNCTIEGGALNSKPSHPTVSYNDTCLAASMVYVDASIGNGGTPYGKQLVKAWVVASADLFGYPSITVIDSTGRVIPEMLVYP